MDNQLEMFSENKLFDEDQELKLCVRCEKKLPLSCFSHVSRRRKDGTSKLRNKCDECCLAEERQRVVLRKVIPKPDKDYSCPICLKKADDFYLVDDSLTRGLHKAWALDHNHLTGEFRGWLCNKCNSALGWFKDDPKIISRALDYLKEHNNGT
jgi:hypothetical protein|tara:strand:+ start:61 stop:519 length:459 start_codon:yes stop_codon:yes gene_type:complete